MLPSSDLFAVDSPPLKDEWFRKAFLKSRTKTKLLIDKVNEIEQNWMKDLIQASIYSHFPKQARQSVIARKH
jgi:hypothetical protein